MTSRLRPKTRNLRPSAAATSFVTKQPINVTTPATPKEVSSPAIAELLTMVLTVVVTVEIILPLGYNLPQRDVFVNSRQPFWLFFDCCHHVALINLSCVLL